MWSGAVNAHIKAIGGNRDERRDEVWAAEKLLTHPNSAGSKHQVLGVVIYLLHPLVTSRSASQRFAPVSLCSEHLTSI